MTDTIFGLAMIGLGIALGLGLSDQDSKRLDACRKAHNVYECVVVAIPAKAKP